MLEGMEVLMGCARSAISPRMADDGVGFARLRLVTGGEDQVAEVVGLGGLDENRKIQATVFSQRSKAGRGIRIRIEANRTAIS